MKFEKGRFEKMAFQNLVFFYNNMKLYTSANF